MISPLNTEGDLNFFIFSKTNLGVSKQRLDETQSDGRLVTTLCFTVNTTFQIQLSLGLQEKLITYMLVRLVRLHA